jgi:hypothetical protein
MNATTDWLVNSSSPDTCDDPTYVVGLAYCTSECP